MKSRRLRLPAIFLGVILVATCLKYAGLWLATADEPVSGGSMLVLMGSTRERSGFAAEYCKQYKMDNVFLVVADPQKFKLGSSPEYVNAIKRMKWGLHSGGVDSSKLHLIKGAANDTFDEAKAMAGYCKAQHCTDTLTIITSSFHIRRTRMIFRDVFKSQGLNTRIVVPLNSYSPYKPDTWYLSLADCIVTGKELVKIVYYWCWLRWQQA